MLSLIRKNTRQIRIDMDKGLLAFVKKYLGIILIFVFIAIREFIPFLKLNKGNNYSILGLLIVLSIFIGGILVGIISAIITTVYGLLMYFNAAPLNVGSTDFRMLLFTIIGMVILAGAIELKNKRLCPDCSVNQYHAELAKDISEIMITSISDKGNILMASRSLCACLGYDEKELLNLKFWDISDAEDLEVEKELFGELISGKRRSYSVEKGIYTKNGDIKRFYKSAHGIKDENSNISQTFNYIIDITEKAEMELIKKESEENLELLNKAIEYEKMKNEFFANVSHELRTPLNVIMGVLQLLTIYNGQEALNCGNVARYIKMMKQNCYRLLRLINNLIDITKIDAGFFEIKLINYDIVKIVEDITLSIVEYIESNELILEFDTNIEEMIIPCDPNQIERIVLNLLANSIKFTKPGGKICVHIEGRDDNVNISIKDTGIGIPECQLDSIFERFCQVEGGYSRDINGSGIGLSLVKSIVEMHKGTIKVKSEEGNGTEFIINLPVYEYEDLVVLDDMKAPRNIECIKIEFSDIYFEEKE